MKLAVISPVQHLEQFSTLGDFDFALAHVLLEERRDRSTSVYRDYFKKQSQAGRIVYLDNGAHEACTVDAHQLVASANDIGATHVVAPDVLGNSLETITKTGEFLSVYESIGTTSFKIIGVAQGTTFKEWLDCYNYMSKNPYVDTIAIPYDISFFVHELTETVSYMNATENRMVLRPTTKSLRQMLTRIHVMDYLRSNDMIKKPIHLLGWSLPQELLYYTEEHKVFSNDSQGYCVYPSEWEVLSLALLDCHLESKIATPHDFWRTIENTRGIVEFITHVRESVV